MTRRSNRRNNRSAARTRAAGFTLVEALVIVAIVGVLLGAGIPALQQMIQRGKLQSATRQMSTMMTMARFQSIKTGSPVLVEIFPDTGEMRSYIDTDLSDSYNPVAGDPLEDERLLNQVVLEGGVNFAGAGTEPMVDGFEFDGTRGVARFNPDGSVVATGAFRFADTRNHFMEVRVEPRASARVEIRKWDDEEEEYLAQGEKGKTWQWGTGE